VGCGGSAGGGREPAAARGRAGGREQDEPAQEAGSSPEAARFWEAARLYVRQGIAESLPLP